MNIIIVDKEQLEATLWGEVSWESIYCAIDRKQLNKADYVLYVEGLNIMIVKTRKESHMQIREYLNEISEKYSYLFEMARYTDSSVSISFKEFIKAEFSEAMFMHNAREYFKRCK